MMPVKIRGRGIEADKQSLHPWCRCNTCERRVGRLSLSLQGRSEKVLASQMGCWSAVILDWGAHPWRKHPGQCSAVGCGLQGRRMALTQGLKCCSLICGQFCSKGDLRGAPPWLPCVHVALGPGVTNMPSSILEKEMATHSSVLARKIP